MLSELKKIGKHTIIYGLGIIVGKAIGFFLIPLYTHYLVPNDYGVLELIEVTGYIIAYFFGLGMDQAILKFYNSAKDDHQKQQVLSTALFFLILFGGILTVSLIPCSKFLAANILGSKEFSFLFILSFIGIYWGSIYGFSQTTLMAKQKSILYTVISLSYTLVVVCLNIYFVAFCKLGVRGIYYSTVITSTIFGFSLALMVFKESRLNFRIETLKGMLKYGLPFVPTGIIAFVLNWSDRYILRLFCSMDVVGLYSLGYKIGMIVVFLVNVPFGLIWNSYIFEVREKDDAKSIYSRLTTYFFFGMWFVGLAISVMSREIIIIIADQSYMNAYKVIPLITLAMTFMCSDQVFRVGLLIEGKTKYLPIAMAIAAGTNILLNFLLIPRYGMMGAAFATMISFLACSLAILYFSQRVYFINFEFRRLFQIATITILVYVVSTVITSKILWVSIMEKLLLLCLVFPLLYLSGFFNEGEKNFLRVQFSLLKNIIISYNANR